MKRGTPCPGQQHAKEVVGYFDSCLLMAGHRFLRTERLRNKKWIDLLFSQGQVTHFPGLRFYYLPSPAVIPYPQVLFVVPKRCLAKATQRQRRRRWLREAYRLHKHFIAAPPTQPTATSFLLAYVYTGASRNKPEDYAGVADSVRRSLQLLASRTIR